MVEWRIGAISEEWSRDWFGIEDESPFAVLREPSFEIWGWGLGFGIADKHLGDCRDIDWGSRAWRGTRGDFLRLAGEARLDPRDFDFMRDGELYALVFIEWY